MTLSIIITGDFQTRAEKPLNVDLEIDDGKPPGMVEISPEQFRVMAGTLEIIKERIREFVTE